MGTTPRGLPYPEPTDPVAAGADAMKALALAVDHRAVMGKIQRADTSAFVDIPAAGRMQIEAGNVSVVWGNGGWGSFNFQAPFSYPPLVIAMSGSWDAGAGGLFFLAARSVTTTGFAFVGIRYDATYPPVGTGAWVSYIAVAPAALT